MNRARCCAAAVLRMLRGRLLLVTLLAPGAATLACNDTGHDGAGLPSEQLVSMPASPDIQFAELKYNFGEVAAGVVAEHTFEFVNRGKGTLLLEKPRGS